MAHFVIIVMFRILDDNDLNDDHDEVFDIGNYDVLNYDVLSVNNRPTQRGQVDSEIVQCQDNLYYGRDI